MPGSYYGVWYYSLWIIGLFVFFLNIRIKNKFIKKLIQHVANNSFAVYMMHLPMLLFYTKNNPITEFKEVVICIIGLFVGINILAEFLRKLPILEWLF